MKQKHLSFQEACHIIKTGEVVAIPTETVYGLAGSIFNESAIKKIFQVKKRPLFNPLIVHCANREQMEKLHNVKAPLLKKMIHYFCPGPLTFILNKTEAIHPLITAGQEKVGLRIPKHPLTLKLLKETEALCAPSANIFSQLSPTQPEHVYSIFKETVPILDGGKCETGIESTVIEPDFENHIIKILRPGTISKEDIEKWLEKEKQGKWTVYITSSSLSPGQSKKHYQPTVPLILIKVIDRNLPTSKEIKQKLDSIFPGKTFKELKLKSSALLTARTLYHKLNTLQKNSHVIYIIKKDIKTYKAGIWGAIWDRLEKACSQKIYWKEEFHENKKKL